MKLTEDKCKRELGWRSLQVLSKGVMWKGKEPQQKENEDTAAIPEDTSHQRHKSEPELQVKGAELVQKHPGEKRFVPVFHLLLVFFFF